MGKFIEIQVVIRHGEFVKTHNSLINTDDISMCTPYNGGTWITLRSTGNNAKPLELEDRYEDVKYKLFTDEVH